MTALTSRPDSGNYAERVTLSRWIALALNGPPLALLLTSAYAAISLGLREALVPMLFFYFFLQASVLFLLSRYGALTLRISSGVLRVTYAGGEIGVPASAVERVEIGRVSTLRIALLPRPLDGTLPFVLRGGPVIRLVFAEPLHTAVGEVAEVLISTLRPDEALEALRSSGFPVVA